MDRRSFWFLSAAAVVCLVTAGSASATTFCVPDFHSGCPDNGSNVAQADLEVAMQTDSTDGIPDIVLVAPHTYTDSETLEPSGLDPLTVAGSGTAETFITSASGSNVFVVNINAGSRPVTMRDLSIVVPPGFPDGSGAALQGDDSVFERVNIEIRNPDSDAAPSLIGDNVFRDCRVFATSGGSVGTGLQTSAVSGSGSLAVVRSTIDGAHTGLKARNDQVPVSFIRSLITGPSTFGLTVDLGSDVEVMNSVIEAGTQSAIHVMTGSSMNEDDASVAVRNSTLAPAANPTAPAIAISIGPAFGSRSAAVSVADSILWGFDRTWEVAVPVGPGLGSADLDLADSNFNPVGLPDGSPHVDFSDPGNINADPLFLASDDYRLSTGSPSIDAAGDSLGGPTVDLDGSPRPRDGNGDGVARPDQGAYEARDSFAPRVSGLRVKRLSRGRVRVRLSLNEPARITGTFRATKRKGRAVRPVTVKKAGKRGPNVLVARATSLRSGRVKVRLVVVDPSGNRTVKTARLAPGR